MSGSHNDEILALLQSLVTDVKDISHRLGKIENDIEHIRRNETRDSLPTPLRPSPFANVNTFTPSNLTGPDQLVQPEVKLEGMSANLQSLPFALESIATKKGRPRKVQTTVCGKPSLIASCFKDRHHDWYMTHDFLVPVGAQRCRLGPECHVVHWENSPNWNAIVEAAKASGQLSLKVPFASLETILY
ncbi:hypothetical protein M011DRAFT_475451 [Sporormia fimetaria CBS 119925]|uniref:Uncharacterized protein n=1 Tax=Sporormia fimetaria CBS 119925 TaxID=1340428 RepID=A0A6A6VFH8_9PLEO|nr:hypothetical protein M011DRAFT_475451 [Sporormia fimetaria CBS 119925]